MDNQQAINQLKQMHADGFDLGLENEDYDALRIAIDALTFQIKLAPIVHKIVAAPDAHAEAVACRLLAKLYNDDIDRALNTTTTQPGENL